MKMSVQVETFQPRKSLRQRLTKEEQQEDKRKKIEEEREKQRRLDARPLLGYRGKLYYHSDKVDIALACDILLTKVNDFPGISIMGFDMEWPFNFQTGAGKTAVIQINPDLHLCYILHVSEMKNLPKSLSELLAHPRVRLTGVNIKCDVRKLARDFTGFDVEKMIENCIELGNIANNIVPIKQRWSMEKLVNQFLDKNINKDKKVRMSKWHIIPLTEVQQRYAAIDSYASLLLYHTLKGVEDAISIDTKGNEEMNKDKESRCTDEHLDKLNGIKDAVNDTLKENEEPNHDKNS